ncbi:MAG: nucleoside hydrolase [Clostridia bacterium]|nr:nucleoside hydrolase [Clostridia bacterium]MBR0422088.1 nucleoside hydrolase [Clostridia bacterium]
MTDNTRIPIWLDTDPGVDDAMAMALLFALPEYDVKGVSAVAGNVELSKTFQNARDLAAFFGRKDVPVFPGADRPLFREPRTAYFVHGENGLGDVTLPRSDAPVEKLPAWDALYEAAKAAEGELVLIAVGPLTNVALALSKHGSLGKLLKKIVIMGGSASYGNATPAAEANIFCDPEAASTVFQCGVPIVMCGLDMTLKTVMTPAELDEMGELNPTAKFLRDAAQHGLAYSQAHGIDGMALHDPTAVLYPLYPELFSGEEAGVAVETKGTITYGKTVTDLYSDKQFPFKNALILLDVDKPKLFETVRSLLKRY